MPLASLDVSWMCGLVNSKITEEQDHLGESIWLDAVKSVLSSAAGRTCVLTHHSMLILWKSGSPVNECDEDWNYHCDGIQRLRMLHCGERVAASVAVVWVELSHGKGHASCVGALAMLHNSGWLTLYRHDGSIVHEQRIFRPNAQHAEQWTPVISHSNGMLLLTAPNAVYVIQDAEIASALDCCGTCPDLSVAAHPWAPNFASPQSLTSFSSCGRLTDDLLGDGARPVKDYLLCTSEAPAMAWIQFSNLRRKRAQSNSTPPECSKAGTPALEMAAQWAAQGIVKFVNAVDGVQGTAIPYSAEETWVIVDNRHMQNIALSPDRLLAACTDNKGRVILVDSVSKTMLRCWKGYRDAEIGWVRWSIAACIEPNTQQDCKKNHNNLRDGDAVLVIYAPNREALEMWLPRCGRRLCNFRCTEFYHVPEEASFRYLPKFKSFWRACSTCWHTLVQYAAEGLISMELHKFVPFIRSSDDFTTFLGVLCEAYTELLNCKPAQFEATVISEKYRFHLDTFVLYAWRPFEALPFAHGTHAYKRFMQLRLQVLDTLSRACKVPSSSSTKRPVICNMVPSAVAAIDVCALYANDQLVACQRIMNTVVEYSSILSGASSPCGALLRKLVSISASWNEFKNNPLYVYAEVASIVHHVEEHLAQVHAWVRQLDAALTVKQVGDVVSSLEDTIATLLSLFLAMPRSMACAMRGSDHAFTAPLAIVHDALLGCTLLEKIGTHPNDVRMRDRVTALSVACVKLARLLLAELMEAAPPTTGPSTSKALDVNIVNDGEELFAALVEMQVFSSPLRSHSTEWCESCLSRNTLQVPEIEHRRSLLASLSEHGFMDAVDDKLRKSELKLDGDQYSYILSLLNLPDRPVPVAGSSDEVVVTNISKAHDSMQNEIKVHAPQYSRTHKQVLIQEVKDCLPEEDEKLIKACLASMNWDTERCVDALLQNKFEFRTKGSGAVTSSGSELVYAPGKANSFAASKGHIKDMKQKTFQLLQMAEDAENEYEDEYDDGFDALNFVKGSKDVRTEADSTETDSQNPHAERIPPAEQSTGLGNGEAGEGSQIYAGASGRGRGGRGGRGGRRENHRGRRGTGGRGGRNSQDRSGKGRGPAIV